MRIAEMHPQLRQEAQTLALENVNAEPAIQRVYLFPSNEEIRLIEIDSTARPIRNGDVVAPFYFGPDPANGLPFPSAIALIRPEEVEVYQPPRGWGTWNEAEVIWR